MGKYVIPAGIGLEWIKNGEEAEKGLDSLYNQEELKKEVYDVLAHYVILSGEYRSRCITVGQYSGTLRLKHSKFGLSGKKYYTLVGILWNHAINQLIGSWKKHEYKSVFETSISRLLGMNPRIQDDNLLLNIDRATMTVSKERVESGEAYKNTIQYLPLCVFFLNRVHEAALPYTS